MTDSTTKTETKYSIPDDHEWADENTGENGRDRPRVHVATHHLLVNDEREEIDRYDGLQWRFLFDDSGKIHAVDLSHYCPGPTHTDPMGFVAWNDVPDRVRQTVRRALNARVDEEIVDIPATREVAEVRP